MFFCSTDKWIVTLAACAHHARKEVLLALLLGSFKLCSNMIKSLRVIFSLLLVLLLAACAGVPPNIQIPKMPPPPPQLVSRPRVVLVLGSGGARGYAHLGVFQVLKKAGVPIDLIVGVSAGSIFGAVYSDNNSFAKTYRIMMSANFWDFADVNNVPHTSGFVRGYHLERFLLHNMRARQFKQLKNKLVVATTNLSSGETYLVQSGPIAPAILASAALPGLVDPVHLYHQVLVDGGVAQPVPVEVAQHFHPQVIIAVNISQQLSPRIPWFSYSIYSRAYDIIWKRLSEENERGASVVIRPQVGDLSTFDLQDKHWLYQQGRVAALKALPQILRLLKQHHIKRYSPPIRMKS